jgi:hypothetical protein
MYLRGQIRIFLLVVSAQLLVARLFSQSPAEDSISFVKTENKALAIYYQSAGDQSRLYNGFHYTGYSFAFAEGHPFFLTDKEQKGSICYDHVEYRGVDLQYDELKGVIIYKDENHRIQLLNERISGFTIGDYKFIRLVPDSLSHNAPATGFYNVLYEGKTGVLKKEIKTIREIFSYSSGERTRVIDQQTVYYFKRNDEYTPVFSQKDLLNYFSQRKKDIQHYIKANKLDFKKDPDHLLVKVAAYYDQQTN